MACGHRPLLVRRWVVRERRKEEGFRETERGGRDGRATTASSCAPQRKYCPLDSLGAWVAGQGICCPGDYAGKLADCRSWARSKADWRGRMTCRLALPRRCH